MGPGGGITLPLRSMVCPPGYYGVGGLVRPGGYAWGSKGGIPRQLDVGVTYPWGQIPLFWPLGYLSTKPYTKKGASYLHRTVP